MTTDSWSLKITFLRRLTDSLVDLSFLLLGISKKPTNKNKEKERTKEKTKI